MHGANEFDHWHPAVTLKLNENLSRKDASAGFYLLRIMMTTVIALGLALGLATVGPRAWAAGTVTTCDEVSLQAALNGGGTVNFSCSGVITLTASLVITTATTIDASGQTVVISGANNLRILTTTANVPLTLTNITLAEGNTTGQGAAIYVDGALSLSDAIFLSNTATLTGGAVYASGPVTILGGTFRNNRCTDNLCVGGGLFTQSTLTISGTQFISNAAEFQGGGGYIVSNAYLHGGLFQENKTNLTNIGSFGGALYAGSDLTLTDTQVLSNSAYYVAGILVEFAAVLNGGLFQNNVCTAPNCFGGGLNAHGTLALTGTQFISNSAAGRGGGADSFGAATLNGGLFLSNTTNGPGGGFYGDNVVTISGTQFISNTANSGGGVSAFGAIRVTDGSFLGNSALQGGGLRADSSAVISNSQFLSNVTSFNGAGAYISNNGPLILNNSAFAYNQAGGSGGGLYANHNTHVTSTTFLRNQATEGGGLYLNNGVSRIVNALFVANRATSGTGMAQYLGTSGLVEVIHNTIASTALANGSAIHVAAGTAGVTNTIIVSHTTGINRAGGTATENYNLFFGNSANTAGGVSGGANSLSGNPAFANQTTDDYHLTAASLAINNGANTGITTDFEGNVRPQQSRFDIGYDESPYITAHDVGVAKTSSASTVLPGQPITYTLNFSNSGGQIATGVVMTDIVPIELVSLSLTSSGATITPTVGMTYSWSVTNLLPSDAGIITITGFISPTLNANLTFTNSLNITSSLDTIAENNLSHAGVTVTPPSLSIVPSINISETQGGSTSAVFTVTLSTANPYTNTFVSYATSNGTASAGSDYLTATGTLTFAPGSTQQLITLTVYGDTTFESDETFTVTLFNAKGASIAVAQGIGTIINDDDLPLAGLSVTNSSPTQLGQATAFTAAITAGANVTYVWNFGDGSATTTPSANLTATHIYTAVGFYTTIVTATNNSSNLSVTTLVTITDVPLGNLNATNSSPTRLGQATAFTAVITAGTNVTYVWNFGDGSGVTLPSSSTTSTHTYSAVGAYTAIVTATNSLGNVAVTTTVTIIDVPLAGLSAINSSPTTLGQATAFTAAITAGTNVTYVWNFGDGSAPTTPTGSPTATHTYTATGSYTAIVTATNGAGSVSATTLVTITNLAPIANAGADQTHNIGASVILDGSGSADPDGHLPLSYRWTQSGGPAVVLNNANNITATFTAPALVTVLTFTLNVSDARGLAGVADSVVITIVNVPPNGLTVSNSSPTTLGQATAFTAAITAGTNVLYTWNFGDGSPVTTPSTATTTTHTYPATGNYTTIVTATNGSGSISASTIVTITNLAPIANAGPDQIVSINSLATLNGSGSADPDGHLPLSYRWTQTGGPAVTLNNANNVTTTFTTPAAVTVLTFTLKVTDVRGLSNVADTVVITVENVAIAGLVATNSSPTGLGLLTTLTATTSAGTNVTYWWNFGDGVSTGASNSPIAAHTYSAMGVYIAIVTATNSVSSLSATTIVTITDAPIGGLSINGPLTTTVGTPTAFTAVQTAGTNVTYSWNVSGPVSGSGNGNPFTFTFNAPGTYVVGVTATNGSSSQTAQINVVVLSRVYLPLVIR